LACALGVAGSATARIIASDGFTPAQDGFSFANYGPGYQNLSADQMRDLFGSGVCALLTKAGDCVLTPPAQAYMDTANRLMATAGHCFGFSVLSLLLFRHQFPQFARTPIQRLKLRANTALQRAIAYTFQWQMLQVVQLSWVHGTPNHLLGFLTNALRRRGGQTYTMAIYRPGFEGGHAVTPYAVDSLGHGRYDVLVYDNNWPDQVRRIHVNTRTDSWSYVAAINPSVPGSVYKGNAQTGTLSLVPTTTGLGVHYCPFCANPGVNPNPYYQLWLQGNPYNHGHLFIQNPQGQGIGYDHGNFISQMPGASAVFPTTATFNNSNQSPLPVYRFPFGTIMNVTIDGFGLRYPDTETVSYIGQNHDVTISRIQISPNQQEHLILNPVEVSMTYTPATSDVQSPVFNSGLVRSAGDYSVIARALSLHPDSVLKFRDYAATSTLVINDFSASGQTFEIQLTQPDAGQARLLSDFTVYQPPGQAIDVEYGQVQNGRPGIQVGQSLAP
jgi:hypothetical protein